MSVSPQFIHSISMTSIVTNQFCSFLYQFIIIHLSFFCIYNKICKSHYIYSTMLFKCSTNISLSLHSSVVMPCMHMTRYIP